MGLTNTTKKVRTVEKNTLSMHAKKVHASWKQRYKFDDLSPSDICHKCGKHFWSCSDDPFTWACVRCGNIIYFTMGAFHQQIDTVIRSERKDDYVHNESGNALLPKLNSGLKSIEFKKKVTK